MEHNANFPAETTSAKAKGAVPVKSLVQVYFPQKGARLTYYNDAFDLQPGDFVFVEGTMAGVRGIVREVYKSFKIKPAEYEKVVSVADTHISGQLHLTKEYFYAVDPEVLPYEKLRTWYMPPEKEEQYEVSCDDMAFPLHQTEAWPVTDVIRERGQDYYDDGHVRVLCLTDGRGRALVQGSSIYEVEFAYSDGQISQLLCTCPCAHTCKHQAAVLLQLQSLLSQAEKHSAQTNPCLCAVHKHDLIHLTLIYQPTGTITL